MRKIIPFVLVLVAALSCGGQVFGISLKTFTERRNEIRHKSKIGVIPESQEPGLINVEWQHYILQQKTAGVAIVGQVALADAFPVSNVIDGSIGSLTFFWVDTSTELPAAGLDVASVLYEANYDPDDPLTYFPLGVSSDPLSNFALPFTVTGFEPVVRGTPFDSLGAPILIVGVEGDNVAVGSVVNIQIPEPATLALVGIAACFVVLRCRRGDKDMGR